MSHKLLILGGALIEPGQVREIHLPITEAANARPVILPITVIRGSQDGPTVFMTAAVHGDELNGTAILRNLYARIKPERLRGTLILIPIVNMLGFLTGSRYMPDRRDLNRVFPGEPDGNMPQRVAYKLFHEILRYADVGIDFHTAAVSRENYPHLRGDMKNALVRKYAKAFGCPVIIDQKGIRGTLRHAATDHGIPTLLFEGGTANRFQRPIVQAGVKGTMTFLRNLGMIRKKPDSEHKLPFQVIVKKTTWIRAERGGLLELRCTPGSLVYRGEPLAIIANPLGKDAQPVPSPVTGLVIGSTMSPLVNPGMPLVHMVQLNRTLKTVENHTRNRKLVL